MGESQFKWTGITNAGKRTDGVIKADDLKTAQAELKKRGIEVTNITKKTGFSFPKMGKKKKKIKPKDILLFTRYLASMLSAGLSITQALEIISKDQENPSMQELIVTLKSNIAGGKTLADTFSLYPEQFSDLYCNLIKAGEKSGTLDKILQRLGNYLEKTENLKRKIKKAVIYPAAIMTVAMIVSGILLIFVVPRFQKMFSSFGAQLPFFTRLIVSFSDFLRGYWYIVFGILFISIWQFRVIYKRSEHFRDQLDKLSLKIYIVGPILRKGIIARYTRTMATTLESGMPIVEAMKSIAPIMGNALYEKAVMNVCENVTSGRGLSASMAETNLFPNMAIQMIGVGEASGSLSDMLNKVADYYEEEVNTVVDNLSSLLEPLIMLVLGVIVGTFVVAMYLPIFKIGDIF